MCHDVTVSKHCKNRTRYLSSRFAWVELSLIWIFSSLSSCTLQCRQQSFVDFVGSFCPLCHRFSSQSLHSEEVVTKFVSKVRDRKHIRRLSEEFQVLFCGFAREWLDTHRLHCLSLRTSWSCGRSLRLRLCSNRRTSLSYSAHFSADLSQAGIRFILFMFAMACSWVHCFLNGPDTLHIVNCSALRVDTTYDVRMPLPES